MERRRPPRKKAPSLEALLREAGDGVRARRRAKTAIYQRIEERMRAPHILSEIVRQLTPPPPLSARVWSRILSSLHPLSQSSFWEQLRAQFAPAAGLQTTLRQRLLPRLAPVTAPVRISRPLKWVAAFALLIFAVQVAPAPFLAPSIAGSSVTVFPTKGSVFIMNGASADEQGALMRQVNTEEQLLGPAIVRTISSGQEQGEATIAGYDDFVARLAPGTAVAIHVNPDRPSPRTHASDLTLFPGGTLWVQSLLPKPLERLVIDFDEGRGIVLISEGSVSITQDAVQVFDGRAIVSVNGEQAQLIAGEALLFDENGTPHLRKLTSVEYMLDWPKANMRRDAVRRKVVSQLQLEQQAAAAGILPTSNLYPVKRLAEKVDELFTMTQEAKVQKRITQAKTRLSEAAALLQEGNPAASVPLQEYRETLISVVTGTGDLAVQSLVTQQVAEAAAGVTAALPDDTGYILKLTLEETRRDLQGAAGAEDLPEDDLAVTRFIDQLQLLEQQAAETDDPASLGDPYESLQQSFAVLSDQLRPQVREEIEQTLTRLGVVVMSLPEEVPVTLEPASPLPSPAMPAHPSVEDITARISRNLRDIRQPRARASYLRREFKSDDVVHHEDKGKILRMLRRLFIDPQNRRAIDADLVSVIDAEMVSMREELQN